MGRIPIWGSNPECGREVMLKSAENVQGFKTADRAKHFKLLDEIPLLF